MTEGKGCPHSHHSHLLLHLKLTMVHAPPPWLILVFESRRRAYIYIHIRNTHTHMNLVSRSNWKMMAYLLPFACYWTNCVAFDTFLTSDSPPPWQERRVPSFWENPFTYKFNYKMTTWCDMWRVIEVTALRTKPTRGSDKEGWHKKGLS